MSTLDIVTGREACPDMYASNGASNNFIQIGVMKSSDVYNLSDYSSTSLTKEEATKLRDWLTRAINQMG